jgi:hypothetical protein
VVVLFVFILMIKPPVFGHQAEGAMTRARRNALILRALVNIGTGFTALVFSGSCSTS